MKLYRAKWPNNSMATIDAVDADCVTADAVYITYMHIELSFPWKSQFAAFFETWEEAHKYLLEHIGQCETAAYKQYTHWNIVLTEAKLLTKEDADNATK